MTINWLDNNQTLSWRKEQFFVDHQHFQFSVFCLMIYLLSNVSVCFLLFAWFVVQMNAIRWLSWLLSFSLSSAFCYFLWSRTANFVSWFLFFCVQQTAVFNCAQNAFFCSIILFSALSHSRWIENSLKDIVWQEMFVLPLIMASGVAMARFFSHWRWRLRRVCPLPVRLQVCARRKWMMEQLYHNQRHHQFFSVFDDGFDCKIDADTNVAY